MYLLIIFLWISFLSSYLSQSTQKEVLQNYNGKGGREVDKTLLESARKSYKNWKKIYI